MANKKTIHSKRCPVCDLAGKAVLEEDDQTGENSCFTKLSGNFELGPDGKLRFKCGHGLVG